MGYIEANEDTLLIALSVEYEVAIGTDYDSHDKQKSLIIEAFDITKGFKELQYSPNVDDDTFRLRNLKSYYRRLIKAQADLREHLSSDSARSNPSESGLAAQRFLLLLGDVLIQLESEVEKWNTKAEE